MFLTDWKHPIRIQGGFFLPMTFSTKFPFEQPKHLSKPPGCLTLREGGSEHTLTFMSSCHAVVSQGALQ